MLSARGLAAAVVVAALVGPAEAQAPLTRLTLDEAVAAAVASNPALASWAGGDSMRSCRLTVAPSRRSPSCSSMRPRPSALRSSTLGTSRSAARTRVPPATGTMPWPARLSASSRRVGRW